MIYLKKTHECKLSTLGDLFKQGKTGIAVDWEVATIHIAIFYAIFF